MFKEYLAAIISVSIMLGGCETSCYGMTQNIDASRTIPSQMQQSYHSSIPFGFYEILNASDNSLLFGTANQTYSMYLLTEDQDLQSVIDTRRISSNVQQSAQNRDCVYMIVEREIEAKSISKTNDNYELQEISISNGVRSICTFYSSEYPRLYGILSSGDMILGKMPLTKSNVAEVSKISITGIETSLFSMSKEDFLNKSIQVANEKIYCIDYTAMTVSGMSEEGEVEFTINLPRSYISIADIKRWNDKTYIVAVKREVDRMSWELLSVRSNGDIQKFTFEKENEKEKPTHVANIEYLCESDDRIWFFARFADDSQLHNYQVVLIEIMIDRIQAYDVQVPYRENQAVIMEDISINSNKEAIVLMVGYLDAEKSNKLSFDCLTAKLPI